MRRPIVFFYTVAKQSRQLPRCEQYKPHPHPQKWPAGSEVTPWHLPLGGHMEFTWKGQWGSGAIQVCGALLLKPKPFSQLFSPSGQNISCMLIFTGQRWPHRAASVLAHSQKPEIRILPPANVFWVWVTQFYILRCTSTVPGYFQGYSKWQLTC